MGPAQQHYLLVLAVVLCLGTLFLYTDSPVTLHRLFTASEYSGQGEITKQSFSPAEVEKLLNDSKLQDGKLTQPNTNQSQDFLIPEQKGENSKQSVKFVLEQSLKQSKKELRESPPKQLVENLRKPPPKQPMENIQKPSSKQPVENLQKPPSKQPVGNLQKPPSKQPVENLQKPPSKQPAGNLQKPPSKQPVENLQKPLSKQPAGNSQDPASEEPVEHIQPKSQQDATVPAYNPEDSMRSNAAHAAERCSKLPAFVVAQNAKAPFAKPRQPRGIVPLEGNTFLYTPITKCGFSTWTMIFHESVGQADRFGEGGRFAWSINYKHLGLRLINLVDPYAENELQYYKDRFLFVRSPWDRLVSAYINKAVKADGRFTKTYHIPCQWLTMSSPSILTFKEFVTCIIDRAKETERPLWSRRAGTNMNIHWAPQVHSSVPCNANYTLISQYDHFQDDATFVIKHFHFNATLQRRNKSERNEKKQLSDWYDELDPDQIKDLQQLYRYDFEIFGFDSMVPSK